MHFYKFHGNGNDFILIDNRNDEFNLDTLRINALCNRYLGVGADGLMLLSASEDYDFEMIYYNADGKLGSMCGNGGRCIAAFANMLGVCDNKMTFMASDGLHDAVIENHTNASSDWDVSIQLSDVVDIKSESDYYYLDTGSPHYIKFVNNVNKVDVPIEGKEIRDSELFQPDGTNVNFVELGRDEIFVRTFERGVEAETLSCGTGVTASAIAAFLHTGTNYKTIRTKGGDFSVSFDSDDINISNIWLRGAAKLVYEGDINI